jgi:hypothetical protein
MPTEAKRTQRKRASTGGGSARTRSQTSSRRKSSNQSSNRSNSASSTRARQRSSSRKSNGSRRIAEARKAVAGSAGNAGHAVGDAASKAKTPLLAGGAALAGLAGGVAIGARGMRRRKVLGVPVPRRSVIKSSSRDLASAAKDVGRLGQQMSELTSEVRRTRETIDGPKHRSPIEVVLDGLTARRSQG